MSPPNIQFAKSPPALRPWNKTICHALADTLFNELEKSRYYTKTGARIGLITYCLCVDLVENKWQRVRRCWTATVAKIIEDPGSGNIRRERHDEVQDQTIREAVTVSLYHIKALNFRFILSLITWYLTQKYLYYELSKFTAISHDACATAPAFFQVTKQCQTPLMWLGAIPCFHPYCDLYLTPIQWSLPE